MVAARQVKCCDVLILKAETGSGKSTQVAQYLADASELGLDLNQCPVTTEKAAECASLLLNVQRLSWLRQDVCPGRVSGCVCSNPQ